MLRGLGGERKFQVVEEADGIEECAVICGHDEFDGVEVSRAAEAACEISAWVYCGIELAAEWAKKSQEAVTMLCGEHQAVLNELSDRDLIS